MAIIIEPKCYCLGCFGEENKIKHYEPPMHVNSTSKWEKEPNPNLILRDSENIDPMSFL